MEEAPENGKESSHSTHANGMNECMQQTNHFELSALPTYTNCTHYVHPTTHTDRSHVWEGTGQKK